MLVKLRVAHPPLLIGQAVNFPLVDHSDRTIFVSIFDNYLWLKGEPVLIVAVLCHLGFLSLHLLFTISFIGANSSTGWSVQKVG